MERLPALTGSGSARQPSPNWREQRLTAVPVTTVAGWWAATDKFVFKFLRQFKGPRRATAPLKRATLHGINACRKATVAVGVSFWQREGHDARSVEEHRESSSKPSFSWPVDFWRGCQDRSAGKWSFSTDGAVATRQQRAGRGGSLLLPTDGSGRNHGPDGRLARESAGVNPRDLGQAVVS